MNMIGVMVMIHGDDKGLVFPPHVKPLQIIVVPVPFKDADTHAIYNAYIETVQTFLGSRVSYRRRYPRQLSTWMEILSLGF